MTPVLTRFGIYLSGLLLAAVAPLAGNSRYAVIIDGQQRDVTLGKPIAHTLANGESITLRVIEKDLLRFSDAALSFDYPATLRPEVSQVDAATRQVMLASSRGTLLLVQVYDGVKPSSLVQTMLAELTREHRKDPKKPLATQPFLKTTTGDRTFTGLRASVWYGLREYHYTVAACDIGAGGILVVTVNATDAKAEEKRLVETFWRTAEIHLAAAPEQGISER